MQLDYDTVCNIHRRTKPAEGRGGGGGEGGGGGGAGCNLGKSRLKVEEVGQKHGAKQFSGQKLDEDRRLEENGVLLTTKGSGMLALADIQI